MKFPNKTKKKNLAINILFSLFAIAILLGTLEIVLRSTHLFGARISWARPDPIFGWRNIPDYRYWHYRENDHPVTGKLNNYGWRDKDWSLKKPENTFRIALLGDSYIEALQIEQDETFQQYAEMSLNNSPDLKVEFLNFGQSGFTQTEELLLLTKEVIKFSPDMVILFFYPENDIDDIDRKTALSDLRPFYLITNNGELILDTSFNETLVFKIKSLINPLKTHSAIISLIAERYNSYRQQRRNRIAKKINDAADTKINGVLSLATASPDPLYLKNYRLNKKLIGNMAQFCKNQGIRFMLVAINIKTYIPAVEKHYILIDPTFNSNFFDADLEEYARSLDVDFLGLQSFFNAYYKDLNSPLQWGHWNYLGHQVVASALTNKLDMIIPHNKRPDLNASSPQEKK